MIVGPRHEAINAHRLIAAKGGEVRLNPLPLKDGRYALPERVVGDPEFVAAKPILEHWRIENPAPDEFFPIPEGAGSNLLIQIDGKLTWLAGRPSSVSMPHPQVFRFEARKDDFGALADVKNRNKRSELVSYKSDGVGVGTVWSSFCMVRGSTPNLPAVTHGIVHQWHSADLGVARSPVLSVNFYRGELQIRTCSSAVLQGGEGAGIRHPKNGVFVVHHSSVAPAEGERLNLVIQATFGEDGYLKAWMNGIRVIDEASPIGYFDDLTDESQRRILGYPHFGIYTVNEPNADVIYLANAEWGTRDLSARVERPLPVPELEW